MYDARTKQPETKLWISFKGLGFRVPGIKLGSAIDGRRFGSLGVLGLGVSGLGY